MLVAAFALGLPTAGCTVAPDGAGNETDVEQTATTSSALSFVTTPAQRERIKYICNNLRGTQSPAIHYRSAEPAGFGTYDESSVWTQTHCTGDGADFIMNWSRTFGDKTISTTLAYNISDSTALTITSNCTGAIADAWRMYNPVAAEYVCENANAALRAWVEDGDAGSVPPTFTKHGNNGTASCSEYCLSRGGTEWVGLERGGGAGKCTGAVRRDTGEAIDCGTTPGYLTGRELTCECANAELKFGNNGTASCSTFCGGAEWGGFSGSCAGGIDTITRRSIGCAEVVGGDSSVACACLRGVLPPRVHIPHFPRPFHF